MGQGSLIQTAATVKGVVMIAVIIVVAILATAVKQLFNISLLELLHTAVRKVSYFIGKVVSKREKRYHRDIEIGKLNNKMRTVKIYKFMHELIIDLKLESTGITPYELMAFIAIGSAIVSYAIALIFFTTTAIMLLLYPIVACATICIMYTRANVAHENRIAAVIESENIICNNIRGGVLLAVKQNLQIIPEETRPYFSDFIDNIEIKNYHIKTALLELNLKLGSMSDDFIKKCIAFELDEEKGVADMFQDVVELNNIKSDLRTEMKHSLEDKVNELRISVVMIAVFLFGVIAIYPSVRNMYFNTVVGNIIIVLDILALIIIYVIATIVRATEL